MPKDSLDVVKKIDEQIDLVSNASSGSLIYALSGSGGVYHIYYKYNTISKSIAGL